MRHFAAAFRLQGLVNACQALPGARGEIASMLASAECDLTALQPRHFAFHAAPLTLCCMRSRPGTGACGVVHGHVRACHCHGWCL